MPLATVHLVALASGASASQYLRALKSFPVKPLVAAKVVRWIIKPEKLSTHLLKQKWDLLLILPADQPIPEICLAQEWVHRHWTITAGVPKSLIHNGFEEKNQKLLHPSPDAVPELTGSLDKPRKASSAQGLELTDEILQWSSSHPQDHAVSMLNLLSFNQGKQAHESYLRYGKAFGESIGAKRGGHAKIVGKVIPDQKTPGEDKYGWDEIALAHYPSIRHFMDMLGSEDYQEVNQKHRVPALRDTCILCTSELDQE
ncbi:uncharacterized protein MYCFIDRAFT_121131, partial [Pseudocercospora fijiensis CIRAD86]